MRVRVLTGDQLTRLHFSELSSKSRDRARRRVLARLAALDLVTPLERRIGGVRAGSAGLVYALGVAGQHVVPLLDADGDGQPAGRPRQPWTPGRVFLAHTLTVAELYVRLVETARTDGFSLAAFLAEPAAWAPNGLGGWLKPDAYAVLQSGNVEDSYWIEVDRATESVAALRRQLLAYLDFVNHGQLGPNDIIPRVLISVPDDKPKRQADVRALLASLPEPADQLFVLTAFERTVPYIMQVLRE